MLSRGAIYHNLAEIQSTNNVWGLMILRYFWVGELVIYQAMNEQLVEVWGIFSARDTFYLWLCYEERRIRRGGGYVTPRFAQPLLIVVFVEIVLVFLLLILRKIGPYCTHWASSLIQNYLAPKMKLYLFHCFDCEWNYFLTRFVVGVVERDFTGIPLRAPLRPSRIFQSIVLDC